MDDLTTHQIRLIDIHVTLANAMRDLADAANVVEQNTPSPTSSEIADTREIITARETLKKAYERCVHLKNTMDAELKK